MKKLSKALVLALSVIMMFAMGATSFAAAPTSGSVTVNPNYEGQKYTLYKLFDAKMTYDDNGNLKAVTYQLPTGKTAADLVYTDSEGTAHQWFELNGNGNVVAKSGVQDEWAKDPNAIKWAKSFGSTVGSAITASSDNDPAVKWTDLAWGYYFVDSSLGSFIGVDTDNPDVTIKDKNKPSNIDKSITGVADEDVAFYAIETQDTTDPGKGAKEEAIAQIGDKVSYKLAVTVQPGGVNYVITDNLTHLKIVADSFKVDGNAIADNSKVDASGTTITDGASTFTIKLAQSYLDSVTDTATLEITYDAIFDMSAVVAGPNPNEVVLEYGKNPDTASDSARVWTAKVSVIKKVENENGDPLQGAGFKLKNSEGKFYKFDNTNGVTWVAEASADEFFTGADGKLINEFKGLKNGTYTLVETTVPDGYNKLDDTTVTIADSDVTEDNLVQTKTVINKKGTVLPSTGGIGTTIFYVLGSLLVVGCGIVLISRRRMHDK